MEKASLLPEIINYSCLLSWAITFTLFIINKSKYDKWTKKNGLVIEIIKDFSDGSSGYAPKIKYTHEKFGECEFVDCVYTNPSRYKIGDSVNIRHQKEKSDNAIIDSLLSKYFLCIILFFFSILATLLWILQFLKVIDAS